MGLIHPESLEMWREWERSRHRARRAKHAVAGAAGSLARRARRRGADGDHDPVAAPVAAWSLHSRAGEGPEASASRVLIAVDSATPSARSALLASLPYLRAGIDVLAPADVVLPEVVGGEWSHTEIADPLDERFADDAPGAVLSIGQHLRAGAAAHRIARRADVPELVVQHGVLTPYAPPLPEGARLLAWSEEDAAFWRSGRPDVQTESVGSQLLWQAGHESAPVDAAARPTFLGQMHGAELPRALSAGTAYRFCRATGARYRPHPAETDAISRTTQRAFARRGIELAPSDVPLADLGTPVVAIFSTGVLEAAARGIPAWVHCPRAPGWVIELWERYGMEEIGTDGRARAMTPAPERPEEEPAARIARILEDAL